MSFGMIVPLGTVLDLAGAFSHYYKTSLPKLC